MMKNEKYLKRMSFSGFYFIFIGKFFEKFLEEILFYKSIYPDVDLFEKDRLSLNFEI